MDDQYASDVVLLVIAVIVFYTVLRFIQKFCCQDDDVSESGDGTRRRHRRFHRNHHSQTTRDINTNILNPSLAVLYIDESVEIQNSLTTVVVNVENLQADYLDLPPSYANSICSSTRSSRYNLNETNECDTRIIVNSNIDYELPPSYEQAVISIKISAPNDDTVSLSDEDT